MYKEKRKLNEPITNYRNIEQGNTENEFILRHLHDSNLNWNIQCIPQAGDKPRWEGLPAIMAMAIEHMRIHEQQTNPVYCMNIAFQQLVTEKVGLRPRSEIVDKFDQTRANFRKEQPNVYYTIKE